MLIFIDILQMGRRKSLDISMKENIIELLDKCVTQQAIACTLKINRGTVCRTISKYKISDFIVGHKPGGGRKIITNCRDERIINRIVRKNSSTHSLLTGKVCLNLISTSAWQPCKE